MKNKLGKQVIIELYGCKQALLNDLKFIEDTMLKTAKKAKATIIKQFFHQFSPYGISGTVVIAESHINIHTWPEHQYAAIDIFTCSDDMDDQAAYDFLRLTFQACDSDTRTIERGNLAKINSVV